MCLPFATRIKMRRECICDRILQYNHPGSERSRERNQIVVPIQSENRPISSVQAFSCRYIVVGKNCSLIISETAIITREILKRKRSRETDCHLADLSIIRGCRSTESKRASV